MSKQRQPQQTQLPPEPSRNASTGTGTGAPAPLPHRAMMESSFDQDFSDVDAWLGMGDSLGGAVARTEANSIEFASDDPDPETVAHELAHVVQNRQSGPVAGGSASMPTDDAEVEARNVAEQAATGQSVEVSEAPAATSQAWDPLDGGVGPAAGVPLPPLEELDEAVRARDAARVETAWWALDDAQKLTVATDRPRAATMLRVLDPFRGPDILNGMPVGLADRIAIAANTWPVDTGALSQVLHDSGIVSANEIVAHASALTPFVAFAASDVLRPILASGPPAAHAAILANEPLAGWVSGGFPGQSCLAVLTLLPAAESTAVRAAVVASAFVRIWLLPDAQPLGTAIATWGDAGPWVREVAPTPGGLVLILAAIQTNAAALGPLLATAFATPAPGDAAFLARDPENPLGNAIVSAIGIADPAGAGRLAGANDWYFPRFQRTGVAITLPVITAFVAAHPDPVAYQVIAITDPATVLFLIPLGWVTDVLPQIAEDQARLATIYGSPANALAANWLETDLTRFRTLCELQDPTPWCVAFGTNLRFTTLLDLAAASTTPAVWAGAVTTVYPAMVAALTGPLAGTRYRGLLALWGDGIGYDGTACTNTFGLMCAARIVAPGAADMVTHKTISSFHTDTAAPQPNSWDIVSFFVPVAPQPDTMRELVNMLKPMTPAELAATNRLIFADHSDWYWQMQQHQNAAVALSGNWFPFSPGLQSGVTTSYAGTNTVIMRATVQGGVSGFMDLSTIETDRSRGRGTATSVGGGTDRRGNATTDSPLNYFQNHARHEFGHSVGQQAYQGMASSGDAWAQLYGGWVDNAPSTSTPMTTAMWTVGNADPVRLRMEADRINCTGADVLSYLLAALSTGTEPPTGHAITDGSTKDISRKFRAIMAVYGNQEFVKYIDAVRRGAGGFGGVPDRAYQFNGYTPQGTTVHIYCSRWNGYAQYDQTFYAAMKAKLGWYSLASPAESFAELYTKKYSQAAPINMAAANGQISPDTFFTQLEASPGVQVAIGAPTNDVSGAMGTAATMPTTESQPANSPQSWRGLIS